MSDGMGRELAYLSSHATNRYFIPNWGNTVFIHVMARPDIGACSNIVCMHIADVCG